MSVIEITFIVIAVVFFILALALIPTIIAIRRTATSVTLLSDMIHEEIKPTIRELTSVLVELKTVGGGVAEHTDDVKRFMSALGESGSQLHTINRAVGVVTTVIGNTSALATGAKVAGKYMIERYFKKRGGI